VEAGVKRGEYQRWLTITERSTRTPSCGRASHLRDVKVLRVPIDPSQERLVRAGWNEREASWQPSLEPSDNRLVILFGSELRKVSDSFAPLPKFKIIGGQTR
jgi:hypothetical protein